MQPRITHDRHGTPAVWAADAARAYFGIGYLHGRHRPLQTLVLAGAGAGRLAALVAPRADLVALDALAHRLDVPGRALAEAARLSARAGAWVDAYVAGCRAGLADGGRPFELRLLGARLPPPTRESVLGAFLLAAYLGLAEGQERMERALVDAVAAGAAPETLAAMFEPHLGGWDPEAMRRTARGPRLGHASHRLVTASSGSNAWAVTGERSASGRPLLCGDPHLQVNQLPSLLYELRARVGEDYWLGATIAGLPGIAVGRNRNVAWSGTFACADNVDFTIEELDGAGARRPGGAHAAIVEREVEIARRWRSPVRLRFLATDRGVLESDSLEDGEVLASRWAGPDRAAEALEAHLALPLAGTAAQAEQTLAGAHTFSLHFVLADRGGDVRYCQGGRIPRRSGGWSGLYPVRGADERRWVGFYEGAALPRAPARDGIVASANEARAAADGVVLATLAQPPYRLRRIEDWLRSRPRHDTGSMRALQLDVVSLQAERLRPFLMEALSAGPLRDALAAWDGACDAGSVVAHAFAEAHRAAVLSLAPELGGDWLAAMLAGSELPVWWGAAFDRLLADPASWGGVRGQRLRSALAAVSPRQPARWGEVQRLTLAHMVLGGLPGSGLDRGPYALPGSPATVRQGTVTRPGGATVVTAPAYRFIADLADEGALTALPGGIDGSRFSATYDRWLGDWLAGEYHQLAPPRDDEAPGVD